MKLLLDILSYKRPYESKSEELFISTILDTIPNMSKDAFGNRILRIPNQDGTPASTLFSSHTDTVHHSEGRQSVLYDAHTNMIRTRYNSTECLGADDGAGMWILLNLIKQNVPGLYIFHRGEEVGGLGSSYIKQNTPKVLENITHALAFDRRANKSIITYQRSTRCCSDDFANKLASELKMDHATDTGGSFTDTANYTTLIPECTNISVGYRSEHRPTETQDVKYLFALKNALLGVDWASLPVVRKVTDAESLYGSWDESDWYGYRKPSSSYYRGQNLQLPRPRKGGKYRQRQQKQQKLSFTDIYDICLTRPTLAADILFDLGITHEAVESARKMYNHLDEDPLLDNMGNF